MGDTCFIGKIHKYFTYKLYGLQEYKMYGRACPKSGLL